MKYIRKHINEDYLDSYENPSEVNDDEISPEFLDDVNTTQLPIFVKDLINDICDVYKNFSKNLNIIKYPTLPSDYTGFLSTADSILQLCRGYNSIMGSYCSFRESNVRRKYLVNTFDYVSVRINHPYNAFIYNSYTMIYDKSRDHLRDLTQKIQKVIDKDENLKNPINFLYVLDYFIECGYYEIKDYIQFHSSDEWLKYFSDHDKVYELSNLKEYGQRIFDFYEYCKSILDEFFTNHSISSLNESYFDKYEDEKDLDSDELSDETLSDIKRNQADILISQHVKETLGKINDLKNHLLKLNHFFNDKVNQLNNLACIEDMLDIVNRDEEQLQHNFVLWSIGRRNIDGDLIASLPTYISVSVAPGDIVFKYKYDLPRCNFYFNWSSHIKIKNYLKTYFEDELDLNLVKNSLITMDDLMKSNNIGNKFNLLFVIWYIVKLVCLNVKVWLSIGLEVSDRHKELAEKYEEFNNYIDWINDYKEFMDVHKFEFMD